MKQTLAVLLFFACLPAALAATPGEVEVGGLLREAPLYGFAFDYGMLSGLRGKPLLINVWASWCGPCRAEMASLERLSRRIKGRQFNIIGISTDDDADSAAAYIRSAKITFDNYLDRKLVMENMLGANTIPLTVLVDAEGRVIKKIRGSREWDDPETLNLLSKVFRVKL